jgi:hypothetical protein
MTAGCKLGSKPAKNDNTCKELIVTTPDVSIPLADKVTVTKIFMENDCLTVRVKYDGCEHSDFDLIHNGKVKKSLPPQINLMLRPVQVDCDKTSELEKEFKFDIKKLQGISGERKIVIRVQRFAEALVYEY